MQERGLSLSDFKLCFCDNIVVFLSASIATTFLMATR